MQSSVSSFADLYYYRGRVALYAMLCSLGEEKGDEVAIQAFTCLAVPEAVMAAGANPAYLDIVANGFNMDASDLRDKITPRTRAIIVQHTYGIPANMDAIVKVANAAGLPLIEDCAHTHISMYHGRPVGSFGAASFYSYEWGKPVVVGIGGNARINHDELRKKVLADYEKYQYPGFISQLRIQLQYLAFGLLFRPSLYWPVRSLFHWLGSLGLAESNYNPISEDDIADDFHLRMPKPLQRRLSRKMQHIGAVSEHSRWVASEYQSRIKSNLVAHPRIPEDVEVVYARYPLLAKNKKTLLYAARKANIELAEWYATPIHPLSGDELRIVGYEPDSCPNAEKRCNQIVTLPTHTNVRKSDVERTVRFFNKL